jgi:DNA-binding transcriptional MerR regulator
MKKEEKTRIAEALGASTIVEADQKEVGSPLDLLALRENFNERLRSSGGRPTDPDWTVSRQVRFKRDSWTRLQDLATEVGERGPRVGPAQVAALLIENSLEEFEESAWQETLEASRAMPLRSKPEAAEAARVTYNQLDDWVQRGWIRPARRRGHQQFFSADEIVRAHWLRSISQESTEVAAIAETLRTRDLGARYLVLSNAETVATVPTRSQLYRALELPGSHLVIDQLPERRRLLGLPPFPGDSDDEERIRRAV